MAKTFAVGEKLTAANTNTYLLNPVGAIQAYVGTTAPTGWLLCDGSDVSRATYADLFDLIGTTFGAGDGTTTFGLPNLKGRVPVGLDSAQTEFDALGETGGAKTHTLTTAELPSHSHGDGTLAAASAGSHTHTISVMTGQTSGAAHNHSVANTVAQGGDLASGFVGAANVTVDSSGAHTHDVTGSTGNTGSGSAHNNLPPYLVVRYIIKV